MYFYTVKKYKKGLFNEMMDRNSRYNSMDILFSFSFVHEPEVCLSQPVSVLLLRRVGQPREGSSFPP
jgi:hypothetical protein